MSIWQAVGEFFGLTWWFWLFWILAPIAVSSLFAWRREAFKEDLRKNSVLLEIKIPREIKRTPQAMEQVLQAIHNLRNSPDNPQEIYAQGEITRWFSLEIVSFAGEIHIYIRMYAKSRAIVEAAFFAYYPDIEIEEVPDYATTFPKNVSELYERGWDMWGTELILAKEAAYPIKSYAAFKGDEDTQFDPMSVTLEILGKLKESEIAAVQIIISPKDKNWKDAYKSTLQKLKEGEKKEEKDGVAALLLRTPGETEMIKAVENNLSKPAFDTILRLIYFSHKTIFSETLTNKGILGAFNQYSSLELNAFKNNGLMATKIQIWKWPHVFTALRGEYRKNRLLYNFRAREMPLGNTFMSKLVTSSPLNLNFHSKAIELTTESLATIFHPPTQTVLTAPYMKRVDSRKVGPPAGMTIFGGEEQIGKFE